MASSFPVLRWMDSDDVFSLRNDGVAMSNEADLSRSIAVDLLSDARAQGRIEGMRMARDVVYRTHFQVGVYSFPATDVVQAIDALIEEESKR